MRPIADSSLVLIVNDFSYAAPVEFFNFLKPFDQFVWFGIVLAAIANAIIHYSIQNCFKEKKYKELTFNEIVFLSFAGLCQIGCIEAYTCCEYILQAGYKLFCFLFIALYTANRKYLCVYIYFSPNQTNF
jgi:hypothetical protein